MKKLIVSALFLLGQISFAQSIPFTTWLSQETLLSTNKILESMSYPDLAAGAIIASPSRQKPDYYFHWIRDAALIADVLVDLYVKSTNPAEKKVFEQKISDYISFSKQNQKAKALSGFGEPKFYVNGDPYSLDWGRPQNDGPALRALAVMRWADLQPQLKASLYQTIIKPDLEYTSQNWQVPSFDLWEEVLGDHFFTLYAQRSALLIGADLAVQMNDPGASDWYLKQAQQITARLKDFVQPTQNYVATTLNVQGYDKGKKSNLDTAVILAILRAPQKSFVSIDDALVVKTIDALITAFNKVYSINHKGYPATAIGRYAEDVYDGDTSVAGNPWVLTTLAVAESYYEMAAREGHLSQSKKLIALGDEFFKRVQFHANPDGSLSEQIQRDTGYMTSAHNLTWNYAAVLTAHWARERALNK